MFSKSRGHAAPGPAKPSQAVARITDEARALRPPSSSLYYACVQERVTARDAELAAINTAMDQAQAEGFAAAVRLMSLDAPERVVFDAFTELSGNGGAQ
jgi:hypothetical protein